MNKVEQVRALFREGEVIECVKNTYIPANDGSRRRITKIGKSFVDGELIGGENPGKPFRMSLPTRVRDVIEVDEREATYYLDQSSERLRGHTITVRSLRLKVLTPGVDELPGIFSEAGEDYEVTPLWGIPGPMERLLDELDAVVEPGATLTLVRHMDGTILGVVEGDESFTALYFTDDGRIARGTINQPPFFDKVDELPPF